MALCNLKLLHYWTEPKFNDIADSSNNLFKPKASLKMELDSSFTLTLFLTAVHHLTKLEQLSLVEVATSIAFLP